MKRQQTVLLSFLGLLLSATVLAADPPLIEAIRNGQTAEALAILEAGASPEATTPEGEFESKTALMWAAEKGEVTVLDALLEAGA